MEIRISDTNLWKGGGQLWKGVATLGIWKKAVTLKAPTQEGRVGAKPMSGAPAEFQGRRKAKVRVRRSGQTRDREASLAELSVLTALNP